MNMRICIIPFFCYYIFFDLNILAAFQCNSKSIPIKEVHSTEDDDFYTGKNK